MSQQVTQLCNSKTWIEIVTVSENGVLSLFIGGPPEIENKGLPQRTRALTVLNWAAPPLSGPLVTTAAKAT